MSWVGLSYLTALAASMHIYVYLWKGADHVERNCLREREERRGEERRRRRWKEDGKWREDGSGEKGWLGGR